MRAFSYASSLPVTRQRRQSYHSICHIQKPNAACKLHGLCFIEAGVISVLHCRNGDLDHFAPVTFTLTWPGDLHIWTWLVRILWRCLHHHSQCTMLHTSGPQAWNQLPVSLHHTDCVATFKRHLKTLLFTAAYGVTNN